MTQSSETGAMRNAVAVTEFSYQFEPIMSAIAAAPSVATCASSETRSAILTGSVANSPSIAGKQRVRRRRSVR